MARVERPRRLVVTADDFGASPGVNQAVIRAHRDGILTTASLMVNGAAAEEAVELAKQHPRLGVGLHLTLVCGRSCLGQRELGGMVDGESRFSERPVVAGVRYFFHRRWHAPLEREIASQFERFRSTGLVLDHVNGHLHFHLHPTVLRILMRRRREWGIRGLRLTRDPWWLNWRLGSGRYGYRLTHFLIFEALAGWAGRQLGSHGLVHTDRVFGLLQHGRVDAHYLDRLIQELPPGDSELYAHPSLEECGGELDALSAPRMRLMAESGGIELLRYQDL